MVKGLDKFAAFFAGDETRYVLIGGVATQLVLEEAGLRARATRDLDIVLCVETLDAAFGQKLWEFIEQGGYEVRQEGSAQRRFYRFAKPADSDYPYMLEFFAREPGRLPLGDDAHLTPVPFEEAVESLSAILMDTEYYTFLHAHTRMHGGVHIVTEQALIPLKARAWVELVARKDADAEAVDSRNIKKHRNDVFQLVQLLTEDDRVEVPPSITADVARFAQDAGAELDADLLRSMDIQESPEVLLARLRACYGVAA